MVTQLAPGMEQACDQPPHQHSPGCRSGCWPWALWVCSPGVSPLQQGQAGGPGPGRHSQWPTGRAGPGILSIHSRSGEGEAGSSPPPLTLVAQSERGWLRKCQHERPLSLEKPFQLKLLNSFFQHEPGQPNDHNILHESSQIQLPPA